VDWIDLAQDRDKCRALVNAVETFGFHKMLGNYRVASQLAASRVLLSCIDLVGYAISGDGIVYSAVASENETNKRI
jgi:hypothetical protein